MGARDFSCMVSGFGQVCVVTSAKVFRPASTLIASSFDQRSVSGIQPH